MDTGILYGCITPHPPILVPAVAGSRVEEVRQTRTAMQTVAHDVQCIAPDVVILISPHAPIAPYAMGVCCSERYAGGFEDFGVASPKLSFEGDAGLAGEIMDACRALKVPAGVIGRPGSTQRLDHGAAVPLHFLVEAGVHCRLVLLAFSGLDVETHRQFGKALACAALSRGERAVLIASGDLSHRLIPGAPAGYSPMGRRFDDAVVAAVTNGDSPTLFHMDEAMRSLAGECGYRSIVVAFGALPEAIPEVLSYEGPFGVGYMVARFVVASQPSTGPETSCAAAPAGLTRDEAEALALARKAVETYVRSGRIIKPPSHPTGVLAQIAGVFVCLKLDGCLRGCIGTFNPTEPSVAGEIVRNAVAAASRDPRFSPVAAEDLDELTYSIDVLSPPEPVPDESQLDPKRFGVIVQAGARKGLLLPDLEGVRTVHAQVDIAKRKAGISPTEPVKLWRFTVRRICEQQ